MIIYFDVLFIYLFFDNIRFEEHNIRDYPRFDRYSHGICDRKFWYRCALRVYIVVAIHVNKKNIATMGYILL